MHCQAKKDGIVEDRGADPISVDLFKLILEWSIMRNNCFMWFWTLCQWNCMARASNIDPLGFHNITLGPDTIIIKYDESKKDKAGEKLSEKNVYANPGNWKECFWTSLGIHIALNQELLSHSEKLFLMPGTKEGAAAARYQSQLIELINQESETVSYHIRLNHANAYGLRKGSATRATSGTTCPPPIPSIARRGEWSMGTVLDVYWHFSEPGDHYLGRILAGLDPLKESFSELPPHWKVTNPMDHPRIKEAANDVYGPIMDAHMTIDNNPKGLLLRCLACIVYHSDELLKVTLEIPGHNFTKISILHDPVLLSDLKELVTIDSTVGVMENPTGIPPHIHQAVQMKVGV